MADALQIAIVALEKIANPIGSAVKYKPDGRDLEANWRYIVTSSDYIRAVATDALHAITQIDGPSTLPDMMARFGRDRRYWRPGFSSGEYAYYHEADNRIYRYGLFAPFGGLSADDILADDWHVVVNGQEGSNG